MAKTVYFLDTKINHVFETNYPEYHREEYNQRISKEEYKKKKHQQDREEMLKSIKPNDTVYTQVLTVSSSGMSRTIKFYIVDNNRIRDISGYVASLTGNKWAKNGGVTFSGCGMDMAFHGVYSLGLALWPNGTPEPHGNRNGEPDDNGGYALNHSHM
jgi:hypothetical protein